MPTAAQGSEKHFYCVNALEYDKPAVIYEKADCSGKSCFIPGPGNWRTWASGAQANCIDIDPITPVSVPPCLAAGQSGKWPPTGGFPSDLSVPVGGVYGLPTSYDNSHTCQVPPDNVWPGLIARDSSSPPAGRLNQQYQSGITDNVGLDTSQLDTRALASHLWARVEPIKAITTTTGLRNAYPYRETYLSKVVIQTWWFFGPGGQLQSEQVQLSPDDIRKYQLNIDHVVEINQVINFISQAWDAATGITENQWTTVQNFIRNNGRRTTASPANDFWVRNCEVYDQFAQHVGGLSNLRGVAARINTLKNRVLLSLLPAARVPNWIADRVLTLEEARGLAEFFQQTNQQARLASASIGAAMDVIAGSTAQEAFSKAFVNWVLGQWQDAVLVMQAAATPAGKRSMMIDGEGGRVVAVKMEVGREVMVF
ncbi:MAG: hypothetical protein Q9182_006776 [Xanthomendoza sp. 2 TL-2023]